MFHFWAKVTISFQAWEVFPGKNTFYCDGRFITANDKTVLCITSTLITMTTALFIFNDYRATLKDQSVSALLERCD